MAGRLGRRFGVGPHDGGLRLQLIMLRGRGLSSRYPTCLKPPICIRTPALQSCWQSPIAFPTQAPVAPAGQRVRERRSERTSAVNNGPQRNLMTLIASSFLAGMLVTTASAHSPRETAKVKTATLEAKTSKAVSEDTDSDVPDDLNALRQIHLT